MNRREFLKSAAHAAIAVSLPVPIMHRAFGQTLPGTAGETKSGHKLRIVHRTIEINGRAAKVFGLHGPDGTPGLSLKTGQLFDIALRNETAEPTIIHWHGLTPPWHQDGVGDAPLPLIAPRAERKFRFPVGAAGTHWMHAHTLQEQSLLATPLIVHDTERRDEQDVVILLHDFSFDPPEELLARLKGGTAKRETIVVWSGTTHGHGSPSTPLSTPQAAAMSMDLNDIDYDAYLANDRTLDDPEVVKVEQGGRVRLRLINGATATAFTIDLGGLDGTLIAVDGQDITPMKGRRFPIAMGQRLDVRVELPRENRAFPILALREGARERTGIVLAPPHSPVERLQPLGPNVGPVVDLSLEQALRAARPLASSVAHRRFKMKLIGSMQGYAWGLDVKPKIVVRPGDRVEVTMANSSMMAHPMHLHGHHFQVVAIDGRRFAGAVRDTVHIPPHRSVTIAFDANNPGQWAFHCHHLYHMATGMMTAVSYES
jgi:FtsP/CotA-like multicopper oxidase with cupredoxin domain